MVSKRRRTLKRRLCHKCNATCDPDISPRVACQARTESGAQRGVSQIARDQRIKGSALQGDWITERKEVIQLQEGTL